MLHRLIAARLVWPLISAVVALAILIGLGSWQLQRKAWKEGIVAKIALRVKAPPVMLEQLPEQGATGDSEYVHVAVTGRFHHDKERYLYAPGTAGLAWHVLTPLEYAPGRVAWINRGVVPDAAKLPAQRTAGQVAGAVTVTGLVRHPQSGAFTPRNDVARNLWYFADRNELSASAFPAGSIVTAPFIVEADASATPAGGLPTAGVTRLVIPNRHLEYAVTWYGLALTLVGVFAAFAFVRLRDSDDPTN